MRLMTPVELLEDHARRPRNVGKLLNATAVGDVGSIVVGDALRFYIQVAGGKLLRQNTKSLIVLTKWPHLRF